MSQILKLTDIHEEKLHGLINEHQITSQYVIIQNQINTNFYNVSADQFANFKLNTDDTIVIETEFINNKYSLIYATDVKNNVHNSLAAQQLEFKVINIAYKFKMLPLVEKIILEIVRKII